MTQITFDVQDALSLFNISFCEISEILKEACSKGADFSDIYFEYSTSRSITLQDGIVSRAQSHIDYGAGIRAVKDLRTGYAYSETGLFPDLLKAAKTASNIADSSANITPVFINPKPHSNRYPIFQKSENYDMNSEKKFLELLNEYICQDSRVIKAAVSLGSCLSKIMYANSIGEINTDLRPMITVSAMCTMQVQNKIESRSTNISYRKESSILVPQLAKKMADDLISQTAILFEATKPKGGEMPVVLGSGDSGILLHEAIGHAFEADFTRKNESIFADKLGQIICNENINIVDDGTIDGERGSLNYDDEGIEGQKTYLVKDGRLESFIHDRISAKYYNVAPTGNGRRESFRDMPLARMRITYMENGESSLQDMISSVKKGIYTSDYSNGQVQIGEGNFTFFVKAGYLIENGKLTQPIKDVNIIGNGPQCLKDIQMVANDFKLNNGAGICGKEGQSVPVGHGMPSVLVNKLTVGGF